MPARPGHPLDFCRDRLDALRADGLARALRLTSPAARPRVERDGRTLLNLSGNNYLGLADDPRVVAAAKAALDRHGVGAGASRLISGSLPPHADLEADLARFKGEEAALVFPTGYAANLGALAALAGPRDVVCSDALNHASLIDGGRLSGATVRRYRHRDVGHLRELLGASRGDGRRLVVTDGVFSMDGDLAPLPALAEVAAEHGAILVVDDAHGTAVLGPEGRGTAAALGVEDGVHVHVGTLSKALGGQGGFVAGRRDLVDILVNAARTFVFTTGLAPALAAAAREALAISVTEGDRRERLAANARALRAALRRAGFAVLPEADEEPVTPIVPVLVGEAARAVALADRLRGLGVLVPAIRPPTVPKGTSRLRASVMATHTADDVAEAAAAFARAGADLGLVPGGR